MSDSLVKLMRASITDPVTGEQLFDMARPDLRTVDVLSCLERLERLTAERDELRRDVVYLANMLSHVTALNPGPDEALQWWHDRGVFRAKYLENRDE